MEKEKLARIVVFVVIAGLVGAYIPLLFAPPQPARQVPAQNDEAASLVPPPSQAPVSPPADSQPAPEPKKEEVNSPDGFGGLEEETKSLEDIDKLLE